MNELLTQAPQETAKHKEELTRKYRENDAMALESSKLVDEEGRLLSHVKEELIKRFCESSEGKDWFMNLNMPGMSISLIELIDEIRKENPSINLSPIVEA